MPSLRQLQIFVAVADCGKMSEAAEKLHFTQPAVSQAISELESYYGVLLFERLTKKLYITDAGMCLLQDAKQLLRDYSRMEERVMEFNRISRIRIGASPTAGIEWINQVIDRLTQDVPDLQPEVFVYTTKNIKLRLENNEIDIALVSNGIQNENIVSLPIIHDQMILACGKGHPFYHRDSISVQDLANQNFVVRESLSASSKRLRTLLDSNRIPYRVVWTSNNVMSVKIATIRNRGICMISKSLVREELKAGLLKELVCDGQKFEQTISICYHKDKYISKILEQFIYACQDCNGMEE